jgi:hypothetical protein
MAIRNAFDYELTPPGANGEKQVAPTDPIDATLGDHTYYFSRRFHFSDGNYTIHLAADDAATLWIGTSQLNSRIVMSVQLSAAGVTSLNIPQGDYRLDVLLQNLPAGTPSYFIMTIMRGDKLIYASTKDGWLVDDVPIADDDLPPPDDYRFTLPVFSVLPNWKDGVTERLTWVTDVMPSETTSEQRRSVRRNARRSFEANFLRQYSRRDRLDTFFVGVGPSEFMLPLWHEAVRMEDGISMEAAGVTFPDGELEFREFYKGDLVFVNSGNPDDYDILQVGDVDYNNNRFSWAFPPPRAWPIGTRIYPMRTARLLVSPRMSNVTDTTSMATAQFDLSQPYKIEADWGSALNGQPYFRFTPDRASTIDVEYGRRNYTIDNQSGVPVTTDHGRFTNGLVSINLRLFGRIPAVGLRKFLQAARGRSVHFYAPTFMQDVMLVDDIPADAEDIIIMPQGFFNYMLRPQPMRIQLQFSFKNGSPSVYATIANVSPIYKTDPDGSVSTPLQIAAERLTMTEPMPAIAMADLKRVSFVVETRFEQDSFELHHHTNQQAAVDVALVLRQALNPRVGTPV